MRSLAVYLKNYKKETILAPFFKFLEVVFDLMVPVVIAHMIDVGIAENNRGVIIRSFFDLILMAGAGLTVSITAQFFVSKRQVRDLPQSFVNLCLIMYRDFPILSLTVLEPPP